MSDEAIKYVIFAVILVVAILVTWFLAIAYRKNVAEAKLGKAEDKAREIIDEALKAAEAKKRETLLQAKEEAMRMRLTKKSRIVGMSFSAWKSVFFPERKISTGRPKP